MDSVMALYGTSRVRAALFRAIPILIAGSVLAGCGGGAIGDALPSFFQREEILPGERRDVVLSGTAQGTAVTEVRPVSVPAAVSNAEWAQPGGFATNATGHLAYSGAANRAWKTGVGTVGRNSRPPTAPPIVHAGRIYTLDAQANVTALNAASGGRAWRVSLKPDREGRHGASGGGLAAADGRLYVATGFGTMAALNPSTGQTVWSKTLDTPPHSAPTAAGGRIFVVSVDNVVYGINGTDGAELWSYRGIPETAGFLSNAAPAVSGDRVVVPFSSGEVMAFNAETGDPIWLDALTRSARFSAVSGLNDVSARPVVDRGVVYAVSVSGRMIAVNLSDGERIWTRNVASAYTPIVAGDAVYVVTLDDEAVALDRSTGDVRWSTKLPANGKRRISWAGPMLAGNRLFVGSTQGDLVALSPSDGQVLATTKVGDPIAMSPIVAAGRMYVLSNDGNLIAFN